MTLPALPLPREWEFPFDPPPEYAVLRASAPVIRVACPTGIDAWLVSSYAGVREPGAHIGFGHGAHTCVGQQIARMELTTVLGALAARVPSLRLAVPLPEVAFRTDSVVRGPAELPVTWDEVLPA